MPTELAPPALAQAPVATSLAERDVAASAHPYTNLAAHQRTGPLVITGGEGVWVYDDEGRAISRGLPACGAQRLGFSEKRLVEAARRAVRQAALLPLLRATGASRADDRAGRAPDRAGADADVQGASSPTRAPRRTTPRSSSSGTTTTRSAGRRRRRSSRGCAATTASRSPRPA